MQGVLDTSQCTFRVAPAMSGPDCAARPPNRRRIAMVEFRSAMNLKKQKS